MRGIWVWAASVALAGCASGDKITRQDLDTMKAELTANDEKIAAGLRKDVTAVDQKYVDVQQVQMEVKRKVEDLDRLEKQVVESSKQLEGRIDLANANVIKLLEFEEQLLAERLATIRSMLQELKKK